MSHITKIAAVETTSAIWEYDPDLPDNRILGGSLDVIAAIRTLAVKVWDRVFLKISVLLSVSNRSNALGNALNISKEFKWKPASQYLS
jgi:hypothetical protein